MWIPIGFSLGQGDGLISVITSIFFAAYLAFSLRRAYDPGWLRSTLSAVFLAAAFYIVLATYRVLLFFTTFCSL
jgi:hypothetical protein